MSDLLNENRVPMNTAQLMQRRLEVRNGPEEIKHSWMDIPFYVGDSIVQNYNRNETMIVLDCPILRRMNPQSSLNKDSTALAIGQDVYKTLQGEVFKKGNLGKSYTHMTKEEVKNNPVWRALARDKTLLNDYVDLIFSEGKSLWRWYEGSFENGMQVVYNHFEAGPYATVRPWRIGGIRFRSSAEAGVINDRDSHLVGIAPEALNASTSNIKAYSIQDLEKARIQLGQITGLSGKESVKDIESLLAKL